MRKWQKKIEKVFAAAAFAEAGEHDTALEMVGSNPVLKEKVIHFFKSVQNVFAAATFAEADCHEMAREYLQPGPAGRASESMRSFLETVGLQGVRVRFVMAQI